MLDFVVFLLQLLALAFLAGFGWLIWWMVKQVRLKKEQILQEWQTLTEQGEGNKDAVFDVLIEALEATNSPMVSWKREEVNVGSVIQKLHDALTIRNSNLPPFRIYFLAFDYGTGLYTAWFLVYQPSLLRRIWNLFLSVLWGIERGSDPRTFLDLGQLLELSAYTTATHSAAKKAVAALTEKLNQDFTKVNTRSKGFLELW